MSKKRRSYELTEADDAPAKPDVPEYLEDGFVVNIDTATVLEQEEHKRIRGENEAFEISAQNIVSSERRRIAPPLDEWLANALPKVRDDFRPDQYDDDEEAEDEEEEEGDEEEDVEEGDFEEEEGEGDEEPDEPDEHEPDEPDEPDEAKGK